MQSRLFVSLNPERMDAIQRIVVHSEETEERKRK
jgi:hypothetical protein